MIQENRLPWVGRRVDERGIASILVNLNDVRHAVHSNPLQGHSLYAAAKLLKTSSFVINDLVKGGFFLKTKIEINPHTRLRQPVIPIDEIEKFKATYVSLYELSKANGMHTFKFDRIRKRFGVEPAEELRFVRAKYFRRSEVFF